MTAKSLPIGEWVKAGYPCIAAGRAWSAHDWQAWDTRYRRCARCGEPSCVAPSYDVPSAIAKRAAPRFTEGQRVRIAAKGGANATTMYRRGYQGEIVKVGRRYDGYRWYSVKLGKLAAISVRECDLELVEGIEAAS